MELRFKEANGLYRFDEYVLPKKRRVYGEDPGPFLISERQAEELAGAFQYFSRWAGYSLGTHLVVVHKQIHAYLPLP